MHVRARLGPGHVGGGAALRGGGGDLALTPEVKELLTSDENYKKMHWTAEFPM